MAYTLRHGRGRIPQQQEDTAMDEGDEPDLDDQEDGREKKRKRGSKKGPPPKVLILRLGSEMAAGL